MFIFFGLSQEMKTGHIAFCALLSTLCSWLSYMYCYRINFMRKEVCADSLFGGNINIPIRNTRTLL